MFVYAADQNKTRQGVDISLNQDDFYTVQDILRESTSQAIDIYIETPGGSGEAAEEIAKFLRKKFSVVNFVIAGEAKSAGTILVLSGDNIYMTDTGSLGPIDAQVRIGRSTVSAHDYKEWVDEKIKEANNNGRLNAFDTTIIAQISPGEIKGVINSLEFAKDLVSEWLEKYKFKNWTVTQTRSLPVSPQMRKDRAKEVAEKLCNHTTWRSHGRSLKIEDIAEELIIERIDSDWTLADLVYRMKVIIRLIFDSSTAFKIYFDSETRLIKNYAVAPSNSSIPTSPTPKPQTTPSTPLPENNGIPSMQKGDKIEVELACPRCGKTHHLWGYVALSSDEINQKQLPVASLIDKNLTLKCDNCELAIDLKPIRSQIEQQINAKITFN